MLAKVHQRFEQLASFSEIPAMNIIRQISLYLGLFLCFSSAAEGSIKPEEIMPMLGCHACHPLRSEGSHLGPSLAGIGQRRTRGELRHTLMSRDETTDEGHMPSYDYLSAEELEQLLEALEQQ